MFSAFRSKTLCFAISITLLVCIGCDPEEKHRILTIFFDGVPPLYEEVIIATDPNSVEIIEVKAGVIWYVHKPWKEDCAICHGERRKERTFSSEVQMLKPPPELCFDCHEGLRSSDKRYVHGPFAVAQCLICHHPHTTANKHILLQPVPKLCYGCHAPDWTNTIDKHELEEYKQCLDCHSGHESRLKYLLKKDWDKKEISNETETPSDDARNDIAIIEQELIEVIDYF